MQTIVDESVNSFRTAVSERLKQGQLDEAEALCLAFIKAHPKQAEGYFQQSLITLQKNDWQSTLNLLKKAIHLNPREAIYHSNTGTALFMLKRYPEATSALEKALSLDPNHVNTLNNLGVVYSLQFKNAKAEALLKRSLEIDPNQADAWLNLCSAVQDLDFREADVVIYAQKAVKLRPRSPTPYTYLGKALLRQGNPKEAIEAMRIALALDGKDPDIHYRMGMCLIELEQIPEAIQAFMQALDLEPQHSETYIALANFLFKIEDFTAAEEAGRQALAFIDGSNNLNKMIATKLLAEILFVVGQFEEAKQLYQNYKHLVQQGHQTTAPNDLIFAPVQATDSWAKDHQMPVREFLSERVWQTEIPTYFGSIPTQVVYHPTTLPRVFVAEIKNAIVVPGHEVVLVDDEKTALYDPLTHRGDWYGLREELLIPLISNDHLLLDLGPKAAEKIDTGILLMSTTGFNYAHWVSEQLSRMYMIEQIPEYQDIPILINEGLYPQQIESLKLITEGRHPILILPEDKRYEVDRLICPSILSTYHRRRYRPTETASPADGPLHPEAIHFLRSNLLPKCRNTSPSRKRLWLSRRQQIKTCQRRMLNEGELETLFLKYGFEVVRTETMSFFEQVQLFSQAEMIVGAGGAAMINMIFAPTDAKIVIFTKNHPQVNFHYFTNIAQIIGQSIAYVCGEPQKSLGVFGAENDFFVDIKAAQQMIDEFLQLP